VSAGSSSADDRRRHRRFVVKVPARIGHGNESFPGLLKDLCKDAALVEGQRVLPLETEVSLILSLPGTGGPLQAVGQVVRVGPGDHGGHDMAILFRDLSPATETRIEFFIAIQEA
jgi:PilZ domain